MDGWMDTECRIPRRLLALGKFSVAGEMFFLSCDGILGWFSPCIQGEDHPKCHHKDGKCVSLL
jgi:hypothetical protein